LLAALAFTAMIILVINYQPSRNCHFFHGYLDNGIPISTSLVGVEYSEDCWVDTVPVLRLLSSAPGILVLVLQSHHMFLFCYVGGGQVKKDTFSCHVLGCKLLHCLIVIGFVLLFFC
jgi:hypothetical protein